jgi:hypothetical protein
MSLHCTTATFVCNFKAWPYKGRRKNYQIARRCVKGPFPITRGSNFLPENVTAPRQPALEVMKPNHDHILDSEEIEEQRVYYRTYKIR